MTIASVDDDTLRFQTGARNNQTFNLFIKR